MSEFKFTDKEKTSVKRCTFGLVQPWFESIPGMGIHRWVAHVLEVVNDSERPTMAKEEEEEEVMQRLMPPLLPNEAVVFEGDNTDLEVLLHEAT